MRTPTMMIIGMVLAPCGLVLNLTSTVAPNWRTLASVPLTSSDVQYHQGLWDICRETVINQDKQCGLGNAEYFSLQMVQVARALMITSLVVTTLGIALASWGVRCWKDIPNYMISACSGIVILFSGVLSLIPVSWYNNKLYNLLPSDTNDPKPTIYVDYCLVLGYLGSCLEVIGGFSLMLCFVPVCKKYMKNRKTTASSMYYSKKPTPQKMNHSSQIYNINSDYNQGDKYSNMGFSIQNDNYQSETPVIAHPRSYTNPVDVTLGENPMNFHKPGSQLSSLPCDSDPL